MVNTCPTEIIVIFTKLFFFCTPGFGKVLLTILIAGRKTTKRFSGKYLYFQRGLLARTRNPFQRNYCPSFCLNFFFVMFLESFAYLTFKI